MDKNNKEKAKKLYESCEVNPEENTLLPVKYFDSQTGGIFHAMVLGNLINRYSQETYEDDWIPLTKETFHIGKQDDDGWKSIKNSIYKLEKKKFVETTMNENQNYIRISTDTFYDAEMYRR